jgi:hypothetical protein
MRSLLTLLDAIHIPFGRPEYQPRNGMTYCNQYVSSVCDIYGFRGFQGMMANQICDALSMSDAWTETKMDKAQELANGGTLIVAAIRGPEHGHVNVICPGRQKYSGRWQEVPTVANVGKENFIGKGINWAFSDMPKLYAWRPSLP